MQLDWCTRDHCGGIFYGPYTCRKAFAIQELMREMDDCDRQDVFLVLWLRKKPFVLLKFKCKGATE